MGKNKNTDNRKPTLSVSMKRKEELENIHFPKRVGVKNALRAKKVQRCSKTESRLRRPAGVSECRWARRSLRVVFSKIVICVSLKLLKRMPQNDSKDEGHVRS